MPSHPQPGLIDRLMMPDAVAQALRRAANEQTSVCVLVEFPVSPPRRYYVRAVGESAVVTANPVFTAAVVDPDGTIHVADGWE